MIPHKQLTLQEIFEDCQEKFTEDKPTFLSLLEQHINHFKDNMCIAKRRTQNEKTSNADLLLSRIIQLITVILADKIHNHELIRSLMSLIAKHFRFGF